MPLSRNPLFVGRDADLRQLAEAFTTGGTAAIGHLEIAATTGLGGIGKTQLACEFVHRYGQFFAGGVFWLSFAEPAVVPAEVAACAGDQGMRLQAEFDDLPLDKQVQLVQAAWETDVPRLLVFDNCEDEVLLDQWRPKHGGARVLLTSRHHHWDPALGVQSLSLDVLHRDDSLTLLRTFRPDLPADDPDLAAFDASVLSEFRRCLVGRAATLFLDVLLERLKTQGLLKSNRQRTDSTHVLAAVSALNRLELVRETALGP